MFVFCLGLALLASALVERPAGAQPPAPSLEELCGTPQQWPELAALCELEPDEAAVHGDLALQSLRLMRRTHEGGLWAAGEDPDPGAWFLAGAAGSAGLTAGAGYEWRNGLVLGGILGYVVDETDRPTLGELDSETLNLELHTVWRRRRGTGRCDAYVEGLLVYGRQWSDVARTIAQPGRPPQTARASPDGRQVGLSVRGGRAWPAGGSLCVGGYGYGHSEYINLEAELQLAFSGGWSLRLKAVEEIEREDQDADTVQAGLVYLFSRRP